MTVFCSVLVFIGKLLLLILAVILAVILILLLIPVKYSGKAFGNSDTITADIRVTWLFRAVSFALCLEKDGSQFSKNADFRIFGISPSRLKRNAAVRKSEHRKQKRKKALKKLKENNPAEYVRLKEEARERKLVQMKESEKDVPRPEEADKSEQSSKKPSSRDRLVGILSVLQNKLTLLIRTVFEKGSELIVKIWKIPGYIYTKIFETAGAIAQKVETVLRWTDFLGDLRTRRAIVRLKKSVFRLLRHIKPRSVSGDAVIGFDDPSLTGSVTGLASAFYPAIYGRLKLVPDFSEKRFEGNIALRGRIIPVVPVFIALITVLDRNVRYCYHYIKNRNKEDL